MHDDRISPLIPSTHHTSGTAPSTARRRIPLLRSSRGALGPAPIPGTVREVTTIERGNSGPVSVRRAKGIHSPDVGHGARGDCTASAGGRIGPFGYLRGVARRAYDASLRVRGRNPQ